MSAHGQSTDDERASVGRSRSSEEAAEVSTDEAPPSLPPMEAVTLGDGKERAASRQSATPRQASSAGMERTQSSQSRSSRRSELRQEASSLSSPSQRIAVQASPSQSSIPEPRQSPLASSSQAMSPLEPNAFRRPSSGLFAKSSSGASARSTSSSSSLVRERVQSIEQRDKRRASVDLARRVSGASSRLSQRKTPLPQADNEDGAASTRSPAKHFSGLRPREERMLEVMASPSRSSAATVTRAGEDDTITLPKAQRANGYHTPVSASFQTESQEDTSSWHPNENGISESEMDAEEKVDMWRNSGRLNTERDSGGSASSGRRRSALPREFRAGAQSAQPDTSPGVAESIDTPTRSARPDILNRIDANTLTRSTSLRSAIISPESRLRRANGVIDGSEPTRLASLRLSSGSVSGARGTVPSATQSDRWEVGSTRTRHSSMMPASGSRDDISGVLSAVEAEREESKARRLALLHSLETTPNGTVTTPRRSMDTLHRPHLSESRIRPSTSFSLRTAREGDAPNSAPAIAPAERRVYSSLRISQNSSNGAPESPLNRLRTSTRMSHRATASEASPRLDRNALRPPIGSESSISSSGTPSRVVMARLMAAMRSASSHEARLLVEACMTLVERASTANVHDASLFESAHKTVAAVDLVSARLHGAALAVQRELEEVENASPEEAQAIVIAGHQHLESVLRDAKRDQQNITEQLTRLLHAATKMITGASKSSDEGASPFKLREERAVTSSPVHQRLMSVGTRLYDRPMWPYRSSNAPTAMQPTQNDREVRRMSSEIMRPSTSMDTSSPRNRFSTQTRHAARSPVSSRTSGEYFSAAEGSSSRRSPFRASTIDGLPDSSTIYETPDEGVPPVRRSSSIFKRFQRSPLKNATVAAFSSAEQSPQPAAVEPSSSVGSVSSSRPRPPSGSISRRGPFMPAMPQRTPTTALSAVNATIEASPVQELFDERNSGDDGRFQRAGTEESTESYRTAEEEGTGVSVVRRGSMGALRKMSSFMKGGK